MASSPEVRERLEAARHELRDALESTREQLRPGLGSRADRKVWVAPLIAAGVGLLLAMTIRGRKRR